MKIGIDIGSRYTKVAYHRDSGELSLTLFDSSEFYRKFGNATDSGFALDIKKLGFTTDAEIIATGFGRERAKLAGAREIPEIQAHAIGASRMLDIKDFTLVDFGGQDTKVIHVENGNAVDFLTSDRCAASTGRFLENMARILGMPLDEFSSYHENPATISSTCAVFAETEIIEKIAQGIKSENLAAGANLSVVKRFATLIRRFPVDIVAASGGVARSPAVIKLLEEELDIEVKVPEHPQFAGAFGCISYRG